MIISRNDANQAVIDETSDDKAIDKERKFVDKELEASGIHNGGVREFYSHRKLWSRFILGWISALIAFNILLTSFVGWRFWGFNFDNMQWFVTSVTAETFIQIVGLGYVAARYLFSNEKNIDRQKRRVFFDSVLS